MSHNQLTEKLNQRKWSQKKFRCWWINLLKKINVLSFLCEINVYVVIYHHKRLCTYKSTDSLKWSSSKKEIVSKWTSLMKRREYSQLESALFCENYAIICKFCSSSSSSISSVLHYKQKLTFLLSSSGFACHHHYSFTSSSQFQYHRIYIFHLYQQYLDESEHLSGSCSHDDVFSAFCCTTAWFNHVSKCMSSYFQK